MTDQVELKPTQVSDMPPMRIVVNCPYCGDAHRLRRIGPMELFACEKADQTLMIDTSLLTIQVLR